MDIPLMIKAYDADDTPYCSYLPLNVVEITTESTKPNARIDGIFFGDDGRLREYLMSTTGEKVKIKSLNCRSYEEFLVALDTHNLIFGRTDNEDCDNLKMAILSNKCSLLQDENDRLKKKLDAIEKAMKAAD